MFHQPVFKKVASAGLNSLQQKGYQILVKTRIFDNPFPKKGQVLVILVPEMIQLSGSVYFLIKWGCRGHWGCWGHWVYRGSKAWKITTGDFRVIQFVEISLIWFLKKCFLGIESWNIKLNFSTFSFGGCWGQPILHLWKLVDETQMGSPCDHAARDILSIFSILLPLRATYFRSYHYETPCTIFGWLIFLQWIVIFSIEKKLHILKQ